MVQDLKNEKEFKDAEFAHVLAEHDEHFYGDENLAKKLQLEYDEGKSNGEVEKDVTEGTKRKKSANHSKVDVSELVAEFKDCVSENITKEVVNVF